MRSMLCSCSKSQQKAVTGAVVGGPSRRRTSVGSESRVRACWASKLTLSIGTREWEHPLDAGCRCNVTKRNVTTATTLRYCATATPVVRCYARPTVESQCGTILRVTHPSTLSVRRWKELEQDACGLSDQARAGGKWTPLYEILTTGQIFDHLSRRKRKRKRIRVELEVATRYVAKKSLCLNVAQTEVASKLVTHGMRRCFKH